MILFRRKKRKEKKLKKRKISCSSSSGMEEIALSENDPDFNASISPDLHNVEDTLELENMGEFEIRESSKEIQTTLDAAANNGTSDNKENWLVKSFVIIKFTINKRDRYYIAKVEELLENSITINTLRKKV